MAEQTPYVYPVEDRWIATYTGRRFNPAAEKPDFALEDIAHALAMTVRYNGHCKYFYSVAEHAVLVSKIVEDATKDPQLAFEALHHDDTEAYLSDVPRPFKDSLPDYRKFDKALDIKLRTFWDLPGQESAVVKDADWVALFIEAYYLLPNKGADFMDPRGLRPMAMLLVSRWPIVNALPASAESMYTLRHEELLEKLRESRPN